jgi:predicted nucleotide-binding protein
MLTTPIGTILGFGAKKRYGKRKNIIVYNLADTVATIGSSRIKELMATSRDESDILLLNKSKAEAEQLIRASITRGKELANRTILAVEGLRQAEADGESWTNYNLSLMSAIFAHPSYRTHYSRFFSSITYADQPFIEAVQWFRASIRDQINQVESDLASLPLMRVSKQSVSGSNQAVKSKSIFIGHGQSKEWLVLEKLLNDQLGLRVIEFDSVSIAGYGVTDRLKEMLNNAGFAFLVMTGDNLRDSSEKRYARDNVIHEVGLFQGRLGFEKAIVLLEQGCEAFSNNHGIVHIPFAKGNIMTASQKILQVLKREGLLMIR